jgi:hypothetical protein
MEQAVFVAEPTEDYGTLPSIWSASEGATPEFKNFPNMLYRYIVGHVVLTSAIIIIFQAIQERRCLRTKNVSTRCSNLILY